MSCQTPDITEAASESVHIEATLRFLMDDSKELYNFTTFHPDLALLIYFPDPVFTKDEELIYLSPSDQTLSIRVSTSI